jgi:hypothetical protein
LLTLITILFQMLFTVSENSHSEFFITERSLESCRIFFQFHSDVLNSSQIDLYKSVYSRVSIVKPYIIYKIHGINKARFIEQCFNRIKGRERPGEDFITKEYLEKLYDNYSDYFSFKEKHFNNIIIYDNDEINF